MLFIRIKNYIQRLFAELSSNDNRIRYFRKQGIKIGGNCIIGKISCVSEPFLVEIGDHVAIAEDVIFITHNPSPWCFTTGLPEDDIFGKIKIGNNVIIGMKCILLPNTVIGDNCIIGAGSIVRGKFPDNSVIMGNPAKVELSMNVLNLLHSQNPHRLKTAKLPFNEKVPIIKKHFNIK